MSVVTPHTCFKALSFGMHAIPGTCEMDAATGLYLNDKFEALCCVTGIAEELLSWLVPTLPGAPMRKTSNFSADRILEFLAGMFPSASRPLGKASHHGFHHTRTLSSLSLP